MYCYNIWLDISKANVYYMFIRNTYGARYDFKIRNFFKSSGDGQLYKNGKGNRLFAKRGKSNGEKSRKRDGRNFD